MPADARLQNPSGSGVSNPALLGVQALKVDPKHPAAQFRRREIEPGLDYGY
jgi:hypothetical protein